MRNKLIMFIGTLLLATAAQAEVFATMPNNSGGRIELSNVSIPANMQRISGCKNAMIAKSWANGVDDIYGCWLVIGDTVAVVWPAGHRTYALSGFTLTADGQALFNSK